MRERVCKPDPRTERMTSEGCSVLEAWNDESDCAVSIARARIAPRVATQLHRLRGVDERYLVVNGTGIVHVGESAPERVGPGDVVIIPAGKTQQITNAGDTDLVFYCICSPRFTPECYEAVE